MFGALITAAPAAATVTTTAVTAPTGRLAYDQNAVTQPLYQITGTSDGTTGDSVDVYAYSSGGRGSVATVPVAADGTFTTTTGLDALSAIGGNSSYPFAVNLRAVPAGTNPFVLSKFSPQPVLLTYSSHSKISGGPNDGKATDFYHAIPQAKGYFDYDALTDCGIVASTPFYGANFDNGSGSGNFLFNCSGYMYPYGDGTTPGLRVDGHTAYGAPNAFDIAGFPDFSDTLSQDAASGDARISESNTLVRCVKADGTAYDLLGPSSGAMACDHYVPVGVKIDRTSTQGSEGLQSAVSDNIISTDGAAHSIDLLYENDFDSINQVYRLPGESTYGRHSKYDALTSFPAAPGSIDLQADPSYGENSIYNPVGAITYNTAPTRLDFFGTNGFYLSYNDRTIPAGGTLNITQTYTQGRTLAEAGALRDRAADGVATPKVSISSPAANAVVTAAQVTVTGKAIDTAIASVTVNGTPASVTSDGTFSAPITLTPGVNTITAEATDGTGQKSQATEQVTYQPPAPQPPAPVITPTGPPPAPKKCLVPLIKRGSTLPSARQKIIAAGCAVGRITAKKSRVAADRVISVNPKGGTSVPIATKIAITVSKRTLKHKKPKAAIRH